MSPLPAAPAPVIAVGRFRCCPIADGEMVYPRAAIYGDDPERTAGIPEQITAPYMPLLVDAGSQRVLIDTGAGPLGPDSSRASRARVSRPRTSMWSSCLTRIPWCWTMEPRGFPKPES